MLRVLLTLGIASLLRPVPPSNPPAVPDELPVETGDVEAAPAPAEVIDVVLPCGLRVITARDASLPVAAVVLAVEVGTRDDPDKLPGLIHVLAYHLQQGNRELGPGEAIATAHDVGGLAAMAVGPGQVRFESLLPASQLDAQLRVEALRLRAPNVNRSLWLKSISYARGDERERPLVPREVIAAAWRDPGLAHDGRSVDEALGDLLDQSIEAQLAKLFDYRAATLVVVGPEDPQKLLERVKPLFADLPARPRKTIAPALPAGSNEIPAEGPASVALARQKGDSLVWAVPGEPRARAWAQVLCGTINRQLAGPDEPAKAKLRCTYADDPRRPLLVVRALGFDPAQGPVPLIAKRLDRIAKAEREPELAALIENQRARIFADLEFDLRSPLELASYLSGASERRDAMQPDVASTRLRSEVLGLPVREEVPGLTASHLVPPKIDSAEALAEAGELARLAAIALVEAVPRLLDTRAAVLPSEAAEPAKPAEPNPAEPANAAEPKAGTP
ncbi:hypothetical protein ACNOYE_02040 [Nannocystaceae bacterium ST9]